MPKYRNYGNSGELNAHSKLDRNKVRAIRKWYQSDKNVTQQRIAVFYGVSDRTISKIISRQTWFWLTEDETE